VADQVVELLVQVEEDGVADQVAVGVDGDVLLGPVDPEVREGVDAQVAEQAQCVRALDEQVRHVVGLVEQRARVCPRPLLRPPVRELRRDRERVGRRRRVAQQLDRVPDAGDRGGEALGGHVIDGRKRHRGAHRADDGIEVAVRPGTDRDR
jgi:hypothetical protein